MRVTQTERPFSILEIKIPQKIYNDENDPLSCNVLASGLQEKRRPKQENSEKENKKLAKIRKDYLKRLEDLQQKHSSQLLSINKKHQQQTKNLTEKHKRQIAEKQEYIRMLEEIVNRGQPLLQTNKPRLVDESKYIYTEHTKNHVPHYEEISDRIDFKLQPRAFEKKMSLDSKSLVDKKRKISQSYSTNHYQHHTSSIQSSKHKLIPKEKPADSHNSDRELKVELSSYKYFGNVKISRPFFL